MLEVERLVSVADMTTKPSSAPHQKHSLGGCTIDVPVELRDTCCCYFSRQWRCRLTNYR